MGASTLKAITRPLSAFAEGAVDLNDVAGGDGYLFVRNAIGLAGRGRAATVAVDEATAFLASIEHDTTVEGLSPVAIGCVPFLPGSAADLVVPHVLVRKHADGSTNVTVVGDNG